MAVLLFSLLLLSIFFIDQSISVDQTRGDLDWSSYGTSDDANSAYKYPSILVCSFVRNKAHVLPYFFGQFEDLDYPKDKISWFIRSDHNIDDSAFLLEEWAKKANQFYANIDLEINETLGNIRVTNYAKEQGPHDWPAPRFHHLMNLKEECLMKGRQDQRDHVLFIDADQLLVHKRTLQSLIDADKPVIAPVLKALDSNYSNFWAGRGEDGYYRRTPEYIPILRRKMQGVFQVPMIHSTFLIDLNKAGCDLLTFDTKKIANYLGPIDDLFVFTESCKRAGVNMFVINTKEFGFLIEQPGPESEDLLIDRNSMLYMATEALYNGPPGLLYSPVIDKPFPIKDKIGFDKVYLINLARRNDRRSRMQANFDVLGIEATIVEAVDGSTLNEDILKEKGMKQIKEYLDPFHKRPMTMGEVGCFLSHYYIWKDVRDNKYQRVLVLEDDLRFVKYFGYMLDKMMGDIEENNLDWDLIYLGRKRLNPKTDGPMVEGVRYLAHVSYSYWTLAYALTFSGAEKLLNEEPLSKLVPVDEYLPIMFDKHPEHDWMKHFKNRNLKAFTVEPLLVYPTHYTGEQGYISDTEDTPIATPVLPMEDKLTLDPKVEAIREEL